jgi:4-hydroxybenzoate polyprenyltransferase
MSMKSLLEVCRTLLILGRVSNLPTVWSNLLAGWFLAAGIIYFPTLAPLLLGGSFLYVGGMYLNDFCDASFDARYCPERPIPAGKISRRAVGILSTVWFAVGLACFAMLGTITFAISLLLFAAIVLYDFRHKNISWAPLVMGACRFLLYPLAASAVRAEVFWYVFLEGVVLGLYVAGITYIARGESRTDKPTRWALFLLFLPVAAAIGQFWLTRGLRWEVPQSGLLLFGMLLLGWMAWLFVPLWRGTNRSIGRLVSGLLAGIVWVDCIAVTSGLGFQAALFLIFFGLALLLQRIIPAT